VKILILDDKRSARQITLRMPARWPWQHDFLAALTRLRALPPPA